MLVNPYTRMPPLSTADGDAGGLPALKAPSHTVFTIIGILKEKVKSVFVSCRQETNTEIPSH